jgi:hypothetical protein
VSFYAKVTFVKKSCKFKTHKSYTKFPFKTVYFLGVMVLTTSSYIVYDYITSRHTDLYSIYVLFTYTVYVHFYTLYIHAYIIYLFISNAIRM